MTSTRIPIGRHHGASLGSCSIPQRRDPGPDAARKSIPCKYLYDDRGSALFDEICDLDEYYLTRTELSILDAHVAEMAEALGEDAS